MSGKHLIRNSGIPYVLKRRDMPSDTAFLALSDHYRLDVAQRSFRSVCDCENRNGYPAWTRHEPSKGSSIV